MAGNYFFGGSLSLAGVLNILFFARLDFFGGPLYYFDSSVI